MFYVAVQTPSQVPGKSKTLVCRGWSYRLLSAGNRNVRPQKRNNMWKGFHKRFFFILLFGLVVSKRHWKHLGVQRNNVATAPRHCYMVSTFLCNVEALVSLGKLRQERSETKQEWRYTAKSLTATSQLHRAQHQELCGVYTEASFHTSPKWKRSHTSRMNERSLREVISARLYILG